MCFYCELWGDGVTPWYMNPRNYARHMYAARPKEAKPSVAKGETDPNAYIKARQAAVDAMEIGKEAFEEAQAKRKAILDVGQGSIGSWLAQVVPLRDAEKMLDFTNPLAMLGCICRQHLLAKLEQPNEFTCLALGVGALKWERWPERYKSGLHFASREETRQWLREKDKKGYFHILMVFGEHFIGGICNCEYPVCEAIQERLDFGSQMLKGHYVAIVDEKLCNGCGICAQRCQFGALKFNVTNDKTGIDQFRCFGCGLCETGCPRGAIKLIDRTTIPSLKEVW
jgi:NAD-dependent dihydropyrimidine dehydrogenase PreA subunit